MLHVFRQRRFRIFRILVLAAFMSGLAGQSLLDVMGDMHVVAVHADVVHEHGLHEDEHQGHDHGLHGDAHQGDDRNGQSGAEEATLHALFHHVHNCGHAAWMIGGETVAAQLTRFNTTPASAAASGRISCDWTNPFRPPRTA